ncbi:MAG: hypothetical protein PHR35_16890 [Kiritimatiellae bacterium]|nr:hypothetical protein [Kiritimatiellia bacterium]
MKANLTLYATTGAIALALFVIGCSSVTIEQPLSAHPTPVDKDKFEGTWLVEKSAVDVKFASNGVARIAGTEWEEDHFRLVQGEMIVTEGKENKYISIRFEEDGVWTNWYYFIQYKFTDSGDLVLWLPNADAFETAIKTNALQGLVTKEQYSKSINVTNAPAALLDFMDDPEGRDLFGYREPIVLRRIAAP